MKTPFLFLALFTFATGLRAETPTPPATSICVPDQLIAYAKMDTEDDFAAKGKPTEGKFQRGIGTWSIQDGAAYAVMEGPSEKRPNGHEAVSEQLTDLGDLIFTAEFKLGESPQVGFVCRDTNTPNLHQGRVQVTPDAMWVQKMSGIAKETRREELERKAIQTDPNTWHTITIEISGDHWHAVIDGQHTLDAHHERFLDRKGRIGIVARGEGAQFRNLAIWSAKAKD